MGAQVGAVEFSVFLAVLDDAEDTVAGWRPCGEHGRGISLIAVNDKSYQGDFFSCTEPTIVVYLGDKFVCLFGV